MTKKITSSLLLVAIFINFTLSPVFANESYSKKHDFIFINNDGKYIEYTYKENGKNYKVLEKLNSECSKTYTEIYEQAKNNSYILKERYSTDVILKDNDSLIVKKTKDGYTTEQVINIGGIVNNYNLEDIQSKNTINNNTLTSRSAAWEFVDRNYGTTYFKNFTVGVVTSIIVSAICGTLGIKAVVTAVISVIAGEVVSKYVPALYFSRKVEYYRENGEVTRLRITTDFYYDNSMKSYIDTDYQLIFGKFPW